MLQPFDLLALLLVASAALAYLNCKVLKLPLTVGLLVGAFGFTLLLIGLNGIFPGLALKHGIRLLLGGIDFPDTLLKGFLGFLLFAGALQVKSSDMMERKWTILALATFGTILSTGLVAYALLGVSSLLGLTVSLPWCLVFGALISPTDPVSVLDVLKRVGISRHLQATVAGESLFNDGVGVVLFTIMLSIATASPAVGPGLLHVAWLFVLEAGGGGLLGFLLGTLAIKALRRVDDYNVELIISLALASGTYSLAGVLGVSGPVAVVVAGILIGNKGVSTAMSDTTRDNLMTFWRLIEEVLVALLFLLIGLEIAAIDLHWRELGATLVMIPVVLVVRWCSVAASAVPLHLRLSNKAGPLLILTWGGLRGGLSVAMALSLPDSPAKAPVLTIAYGIVVFSIVVQGLTLAPLAARLMSEAPAQKRKFVLF
jgi:CPA1 family monovalent cation:H+ antiporter